MGIPVSSRIVNGLTQLAPGLESAPFQRQRAQHLPPRLDEVEIGGVLWLEDELPAWMRDRKQEHISRPMSAQVVQNRANAIGLGWQPGVDFVQEIGEVERERPSWVLVSASPLAGRKAPKT